MCIYSKHNIICYQESVLLARIGGKTLRWDRIFSITMYDRLYVCVSPASHFVHVPRAEPGSALSG